MTRHRLSPATRRRISRLASQAAARHLAGASLRASLRWLDRRLKEVR